MRGNRKISQHKMIQEIELEFKREKKTLGVYKNYI